MSPPPNNLTSLGAFVFLLSVVTAPPCVSLSAAEKAGRPRRILTIEAIRKWADAQRQALRSLRAEFRVYNSLVDQEHWLQVVLWAKGPARRLRFRRFFRGEWSREINDYDSFYAGGFFNVHYPLQHAFQLARRNAVPPFTNKIRAHVFFETLAWWPPDDTSEPPRFRERNLFLHDLLADERCAVGDYQEAFRDRWCHVVGVPGECQFWIDSRDMALIRRDCFVESPPKLLSHAELSDYREVAPGIRLPHRLRRQIPGVVDADIVVDRYEVNAVADGCFEFNPAPGTLVSDRDTDRSWQIPGGLECFDEICDHAAALSRRAERRAPPGYVRPSVFSVSALAGGLAGVILCRFARRRANGP